jgi:hypothetical protein
MTVMTAPRHPALAGLDDINWTSTESILTGSQPAYEAITAGTGLLDELLRSLPGNEALAAMCERYDFMDKLVLHDAPDAGVRVRLHLYRGGYFDRPHPHRWDFFAGIYRGSYRHRIFGTDDHFSTTTDPSKLRPLIERIERPGSTYALHHSTVHSVQAEADTISIVVRGPATSDRFLVLDAESGRSFWAYGAASESPDQRAAKQMSPDQLLATIRQVRHLTGVDPLPSRNAKGPAQ